MTRIASRKYVDGSRGQPCSLRIPGCCDGGGETTVFAHIRDGHTGRSIKASDISGCDACYGCHRKFDGHDGAPLPPVEWLFYALRGLQETLENRIRRGLLFVTQDVVRDKPTPARKPVEQRRKVSASRPLESRSNWPEGRKIPSRKSAKATP